MSPDPKVHPFSVGYVKMSLRCLISPRRKKLHVVTRFEKIGLGLTFTEGLVPMLFFIKTLTMKEILMRDNFQAS